MSDKDANNTQTDMQLKNKHKVGDAESSLQTNQQVIGEPSQQSIDQPSLKVGGGPAGTHEQLPETMVETEF